MLRFFGRRFPLKTAIFFAILLYVFNTGQGPVALIFWNLVIFGGMAILKRLVLRPIQRRRYRAA